MRFIAERYNRKAIELEEAGDLSGAVELYRKAIRSDRSWSVPWYNLGLLHKRTRDWRESFECNLKAVSLAPSDEDAWWNLGIAATAIGDWAQARRAWSACGIPIEEGEGPVEAGFGLTPIRLDPKGNGEVVWCDRIDPARAIIRSIPLPASGRHYDDLLLHDGAPEGYRLRDGVEIPVFNELELIRPGDYRTFVIGLERMDPDAADELLDHLDRAGFPNEDWSSSLRLICTACSDGSASPGEHRHAPDPDAPRRIGIAAKSADLLRRSLENWLSSHPETGIFDAGEIFPA